MRIPTLLASFILLSLACNEPVKQPAELAGLGSERDTHISSSPLIVAVCTEIGRMRTVQGSTNAVVLLLESDQHSTAIMRCAGEGVPECFVVKQVNYSNGILLGPDGKTRATLIRSRLRSSDGKKAVVDLSLQDGERSVAWIELRLALESERWMVTSRLFKGAT